MFQRILKFRKNFMGFKEMIRGVREKGEEGRSIGPKSKGLPGVMLSRRVF